MEIFDIPVDNMMSAFEAHLNDDNSENNRILFSGPFGCGKTFFLKKFFEQKDQRYRAFHLFPVNYQVSSNRDVFKLLKYDILLKLIDHDLINNEHDVSQLQSMKRFIGGTGKDVVLDLLESLPQIGGFISAGKKLKEFAEKYKEEQDSNSEEKYVQSIIDQLQEKEGSIYELDNLTSFISQKLAKANNLQNVLIIDDLDRIDPEQIFRILNLLTAHIDNQSYSSIEQKNKFGFDKIIIVCDVENIRQIFHERYGQNVNFSGYIDKFYSKTIFEYRIHDEIEKQIREIITPYLNEVNENPREKHLLFGFCEPTLKMFVSEGILQIRELKKLFLNPSPDITGFSKVFPDSGLHKDSFGYFHITRFFLHVFNNDLHKFSKAIDLCTEKAQEHINEEQAYFEISEMLGVFLPFIAYTKVYPFMGKAQFAEINDEVHSFLVVNGRDPFRRNVFDTVFVKDGSTEVKECSQVQTKPKTIFKAWRKALKATHGI
jgi:hypothetical protein